MKETKQSYQKPCVAVVASASKNARSKQSVSSICLMNLEKDCSHRFSANSFKLFRLPMPSPGTVLGLLGQNGIGKTTSLKVFSGEIKPNLGKFDAPPDWIEIIQYYRGSSLQDYFQKMSEGKLKVNNKPQYVDKIPKAVTGRVGDLLEKVDERKQLDAIADDLELKKFGGAPGGVEWR